MSSRRRTWDGNVYNVTKRGEYWQVIVYRERPPHVIIGLCRHPHLGPKPAEHCRDRYLRMAGAPRAVITGDWWRRR